MTPTMPVAVVGLACRAPGAADVDAFWQLVVEGRHAVQSLERAELVSHGETIDRIDNAHFVPAYGYLDDAECFDAAFFGIAPGEASLMDPQIRVGLECAQAAFDGAGRRPGPDLGRVGVFVSASMSTYLANAMMTQPDLAGQHGGLRLLMAADKDHLAGQIAYRLDLRGPAFAVGAACASSLVAIDLACRSLAAGDVEMALAGGVSIHFPQSHGYVHEAGGIYSREGRCRAYDAHADGVTPGAGAAMVLLKPLAKALEDGDVIHAVILGSAVAGDGGGKVGYTAPSEDGQVEAITLAWQRAGIAPAQAGLVEGHGTGTPLGDAVEIAALQRAMPGARCALGSVKSNVGHLDAAAGALSFIKAVKAVEQGIIPPSLHVDTPSPALVGANAQFTIPTTAAPWPPCVQRIAAVTSVGIGGANAHVVLAQPPARARGADAPVPLVLAARDAGALRRLALRVCAALDDGHALSLRDLAWTLAQRSAHFPVRAARRVCDSAEARHWLGLLGSDVTLASEALGDDAAGNAAAAWLDGGDGAMLLSALDGVARRRLALPAYPFERRLHRLEPRIPRVIPAGVPQSFPALLATMCDAHLADGLPATIDQRPGLAEALDELCTRLVFDVLMAVGAFDEGGQLLDRPALLTRYPVDVAMQPLLDFLLGVAFEEKLSMDAPPPSLATLTQAVVSADAGFAAFARLLVDCARQLPAALSNARSGTAALYGEAGQRNIAAVLSRTPPHSEVPSAAKVLAEVISCWARVQGRPVRVLEFGAGMGGLTSALVEVLPGGGVELVVTDLSRLFLDELEQRWSSHDGVTFRTLDVTRDPITQGYAEHSFDIVVALDALHAVHDRDVGLDTVRRLLRPGGHVVALESMRPSRWSSLLWGLSPAWWAARADRAGPLRTLTAWERYVEGQSAGFASALVRHAAPVTGAELGMLVLENTSAGQAVEGAPGDWLYTPSWSPMGRILPARIPGPTLMLLPDEPVGAAIASICRARAGAAVTLQCIAGAQYAEVDATTIRVRPDSAADLTRAFKAFRLHERGAVRLLHGFALPDSGRADGTSRRVRGFDSLVALAQALAEAGVDGEVRLGVLTAGICDVSGGERLDPLAALVDAPVQLIAREQPNIQALRLDIDIDEDEAALAQAVETILGLLEEPPRETLMALRRRRLWRESFERHRRVPAANLADHLPFGSCVLVLGGLGNIGAALAEVLACVPGVHLALAGRRPPIIGDVDRVRLKQEAGELDPARCAALVRMLDSGATVSVHALDIGDANELARTMAELESSRGPIRGVVHAAGEPDRGGVMLRRQPEATAAALHAKVDGLVALRAALGERQPDLLVLCASVGALLPKLKFGEAAYVAGNLHLTATAQASAREGAGRVLALSWTDWRDGGMWFQAQQRLHAQYRMSDAQAEAMPDLLHAITAEQGRQAFLRALSLDCQHVVVCAQPLDALLARHAMYSSVDHASFLESRAFTRQATAVSCASTSEPAAGDALQMQLGLLWAELLGVPSVGPDDDFFDLGGDSLLGIRILNRLRVDFGVDDSLAGLMSATTLRSLAERVTLLRKRFADSQPDQASAASGNAFEDFRL